MPLKRLISKKLQIIKRKFADDPKTRSPQQAKLKMMESIYESEAYIGKNNLSKILLNELIACKPEVNKINYYYLLKDKNLSILGI